MLSGKNVELKLIEEEDLPRIVEWRNFMYDIFYEFPFCVSGTKLWFEKHLKSTDILFMIYSYTFEYPDDPIGMVGLTHIDYRNKNAEFGRFLIAGEQNRRKGYGSEAVKLILEYAFDHLNLHKVYLDTIENNDAALEFYKKIGFKPEGLKRDHIYKSGKYVDLICMSILRGEI